MTDITLQPQDEKDAVVRTNIRNTIKRARGLKAEADNLKKQLLDGIEDDKVKDACGDEYEAFKEAINGL